MHAESADSILVGISSCLLGQRVRYDGTDRFQPQLVEELSRYFTLLPVCPETEAGLGIPRPPIKLRGDGVSRELDAVLVEDPAQAVTLELKRCIRARVAGLEHISGFVFKARSPSCGLNDTPIEIDGRLQAGSGLFAAALTARYQGLPVADEIELARPARLESFCRRVCRRAGRRFVRQV